MEAGSSESDRSLRSLLSARRSEEGDLSALRCDFINPRHTRHQSLEPVTPQESAEALRPSSSQVSTFPKRLSAWPVSTDHARVVVQDYIEYVLIYSANLLSASVVASCLLSACFLSFTFTMYMFRVLVCALAAARNTSCTYNQVCNVSSTK